MISLIATTVGNWDRLVKPMLDSINEHEPEVEVIIVDAGGKMPDAYDGNVRIIKTGMLNCQEAQNVGLEASEADWFLVTDVDVICVAPFAHLFKGLSPRLIYGPSRHGAGYQSLPYDWLDGWCYAFSREFYETVGGFDEAFEASGFEDADLCYRGYKQGFGIAHIDLPFKHLIDGVKYQITDSYSDARSRNIERVKEKHGTFSDKKRGLLDWGPARVPQVLSGAAD